MIVDSDCIRQQIVNVCRQPNYLCIEMSLGTIQKLLGQVFTSW